MQGVKKSIIILSHQNRLPSVGRLFEPLINKLGANLFELDAKEHKNLKATFKKLNVTKYDLIVIDLHFKKLIKVRKLLQTLPKLVFIDEDACQNFIPKSKWFGQFVLIL